MATITTTETSVPTIKLLLKLKDKDVQNELKNTIELLKYTNVNDEDERLKLVNYMNKTLTNDNHDYHDEYETMRDNIQEVQDILYELYRDPDVRLLISELLKVSIFDKSIISLLKSRIDKECSEKEEVIEENKKLKIQIEMLENSLNKYDKDRVEAIVAFIKRYNSRKIKHCNKNKPLSFFLNIND